MIDASKALAEGVQFFRGAVSHAGRFSHFNRHAAVVVVTSSTTAGLLLVTLTCGMPWWFCAPVVAGIGFYAIYSIRNAPPEE